MSGRHAGARPLDLQPAARVAPGAPRVAPGAPRPVRRGPLVGPLRLVVGFLVVLLVVVVGLQLWALLPMLFALALLVWRLSNG